MKRTVKMLGMAVLALILVAGCQKMQTAETTALDQGSGQNAATGEGGAMESSTGTLGTIVVGPATYSVEIAQTDSEKATGLMGRESLPEGNGMWFVFDAPQVMQFWMKNTAIPLDIIFVGQDMKVVSVFENAVPFKDDKIVPDAPAQYVLEVNAGQVAKHGIKKGDTVEKRIGPQ